MTSSADAIRTVAVLGGGTMGNGIAHVFARSGYAVILRDVEQRFLDRALETISKNLDREIKKGAVAAAEKPNILARIRPVTDMLAIAAADFVVEAVPERLELKREVLAQADLVLRPDAILATNTSSISITLLAAATRRPERFVGMHFMNPVPMMALVEVIRALQTGDAAFAADHAALRKDRQKAGGGERFAGICVESRADAADQRGGFLRDGGRGHGGSGGRGDEDGDESPDGAAGVGGFYRAGCLR